MAFLSFGSCEGVGPLWASLKALAWLNCRLRAGRPWYWDPPSVVSGDEHPKDDTVYIYIYISYIIYHIYIYTHNGFRSTLDAQGARSCKVFFSFPEPLAVPNQAVDSCTSQACHLGKTWKQPWLLLWVRSLRPQNLGSWRSFIWVLNVDAPSVLVVCCKYSRISI